MELEGAADGVGGPVKGGEESVAGVVPFVAVMVAEALTEEEVVKADGFGAEGVAESSFEVGGTDEVGEEQDLKDGLGSGRMGWGAH
jgi:hypothetical protein